MISEQYLRPGPISATAGKPSLTMGAHPFFLLAIWISQSG
jgi:hypothetical protein